MSNTMMFGLMPAMVIVAFVLSILAYTRKNKFIVKDENGQHVTVKSWHNSDFGKDFMSSYIYDINTEHNVMRQKTQYQNLLNITEFYKFAE